MPKTIAKPIRLTALKTVAKQAVFKRDSNLQTNTEARQRLKDKLGLEPDADGKYIFFKQVHNVTLQGTSYGGITYMTGSIVAKKASTNPQQDCAAGINVFFLTPEYSTEFPSYHLLLALEVDAKDLACVPISYKKNIPTYLHAPKGRVHKAKVLGEVYPVHRVPSITQITVGVNLSTLPSTKTKKSPAKKK